MIPVTVFSVTHSQGFASSGISYTIILKSKNDNRILPMVIGLPEAEAIIVEINSTKTRSPLTHDVSTTMLNLLEAQILKVVVTELKEETYYAVIELKHKDKVYSIDSRPSDAMALALRFNAPIYVSNEVMNESSYILEEDINIFENETEIKSQIEILKEKLDNAIKNEQYEEAAKLRDEIDELKQQQ